MNEPPLHWEDRSQELGRATCNEDIWPSILPSPSVQRPRRSQSSRPWLRMVSSFRAKVGSVVPAIQFNFSLTSPTVPEAFFARSDSEPFSIICPASRATMTSVSRTSSKSGCSPILVDRLSTSVVFPLLLGFKGASLASKVYANTMLCTTSQDHFISRQPSQPTFLLGAGVHLPGELGNDTGYCFVGPDNSVPFPIHNHCKLNYAVFSIRNQSDKLFNCHGRTTNLVALYLPRYGVRIALTNCLCRCQLCR